MLTPEGCRARQQRFIERLDQAGIPAAVISDPRDIYYLTGLLPENKGYPYPSLLFLGPNRPSWLATGLAEGEGVVDEKRVYPTNLLYTLNPDCHVRLAELVRDAAGACRGLSRVGYQQEALPFTIQQAFAAAADPAEWVPVDAILQDLQLRKDPDEIACIRRAIDATLAGYTRAQEIIRPGITELEVMTECHMAALRHSGQVHYYNGDFRAAAFGGPARPRPIQAGELYIIDAWSDLDGYWCDMSRTWVVGGEPSDLQAGVFDHLSAILRSVPEMARIGRSTTEFWAELDERIREHPHLADRGLVHHGGHGVGLRVHEGPDLNRDRGGTFEVGNVFTCEPGAYSPELNAGVRLENLFLVTEEGTRVLSDYPLSLVPDPGCPLP